MFQYALARSISEKGQKVYLDVLRPYKDYDDELPYEQRAYGLKNYAITLRQADLKRSRKWKFLRKKTIWEKLIFELSKKEKWPYVHMSEDGFFGRYNPKLLTLEGNYYLAGTFQNEGYFKEIRPILLKEFQLKKKPVLEAELKTVLIGRNTVSVHIRRGDYVTHQKTFGLCSLTYYKRAMQFIKERVKQPVFLFFSNDMKWVKDNFQAEADEEYYYVNADGTLKDYEELYIMSKCKHNIIANSSFSWWGAWLNESDDKIVIAPKVWRRDDLSYRVAPKEWITM